MQNFSSFGLPEQLLRTLENMKFVTPTPIQAQAIPPALQGKDILGSAQTGTGKTAAFSIPMIVRLLSNPDSSALILTPTRELATQVVEMVGRLLGKGSGIRIALLIGGDSMTKQFEQLRAKARIVVGTPGRINDHLQRGSLTLDRTDFLVLDETDRMLDMGFGPQLERIAKYLTAPRQTLLFSATLPSDILKLASKYVKDPVRIAIDPVTKPADKVKHELIQTSESEKYGHLVSQLDERQGSILVFVKTKRNADRLCIKLHKEEHSVDTIHGDLRQNKRERVIQAFRNRKYRILIATDIAARGLDIPHIEHVINYDLPQSPEDFIHRIGRTARAGAAGLAVSFITSQDGAKWKAIHKLLNPDEKTSKGSRGASSATTGAVRRKAGANRAEQQRSSRFRFASGFDADQPVRKGQRFSDNSAFRQEGFKNRRRNQTETKPYKSYQKQDNELSEFSPMLNESKVVAKKTYRDQMKSRSQPDDNSFESTDPLERNEMKVKKFRGDQMGSRTYVKENDSKSQRMRGFNREERATRATSKFSKKSVRDHEGTEFALRRPKSSAKGFDLDKNDHERPYAKRRPSFSAGAAPKDGKFSRKSPSSGFAARKAKKASDSYPMGGKRSGTNRKSVRFGGR